MTDADRDVVRAVVASETGMWPEAGGLNDQPLWFVAARPIVVAELEDWRRREREAAAARAKP